MTNSSLNATNASANRACSSNVLRVRRVFLLKLDFSTTSRIWAMLNPFLNQPQLRRRAGNDETQERLQHQRNYASILYNY